MFIYNTTYLVPDRQYGIWVKWVREQHIPKMAKAGFLKPQLARVLTTDPEQEGSSVSVQFQIESIEQINEWYEAEGASVQQELSAMFGEEVLSFSTVLEII